MRVLLYTHSLLSDWNHGNAHFLRGVMRDLVDRGFQAKALEPAGAWSRENLEKDQGEAAIARFAQDFPTLQSATYDAGFNHEAALDQADVVLVHEWTDPVLVARIGKARREGGRFALLFHDTHHRAVSAETDIGGLDLSGYDAVLSFGETLRERYLKAGWGRNVFTWHEAADDRLFKPHPEIEKTDDLIWIGNWGDDERTAEIASFLVEPVAKLKLKATVRGVRYPRSALDSLQAAGLRYGGWIANADVPLAFAQAKLTMHIPRRPYVESLPGIPTIRMFEALACGIPLISAPWNDVEGLFSAGKDFLFAGNGEEMTGKIRALLADPEQRAEISASGLETIRTRHTCRHRVDELLLILAGLGVDTAPDITREASA